MTEHFFFVRNYGHCADKCITKYLGHIGLTMIQTAYHIHDKLSVRFLQHIHAPPPSNLTFKPWFPINEPPKWPNQPPNGELPPE